MKTVVDNIEFSGLFVEQPADTNTYMHFSNFFPNIHFLEWNDLPYYTELSTASVW